MDKLKDQFGGVGWWYPGMDEDYWKDLREIYAERKKPIEIIADDALYYTFKFTNLSYVARQLINEEWKILFGKMFFPYEKCL